jgi:hypothetical protein
VHQAVLYLYRACGADINFNERCKGDSIQFGEILLSSFLDYQPHYHKVYLIIFFNQFSYLATTLRKKCDRKSKVGLEIITAMKNQLAELKLKMKMKMKIASRSNTLKTKTLKLTKNTQRILNLL